MLGESKRKILILDEDDRVLWALKDALETAGYETWTTWSGHDALALIDTGNFDVLLTANYVPDIQVGELLRRISEMLTGQRVGVNCPKDNGAFVGWLCSGCCGSRESVRACCDDTWGVSPTRAVKMNIAPPRNNTFLNFFFLAFRGYFDSPPRKQFHLYSDADFPRVWGYFANVRSMARYGPALNRIMRALETGVYVTVREFHHDSRLRSEGPSDSEF